MSAKRSRFPQLLDEAIATHGLRRVELALKSLRSNSRSDVLTIIANKGNHKIPDKYLRGEVFFASKGNLDFSSGPKIKKQFIDIIKRLRGKLQEKPWKKIYLIPTGHPALSIQLKLCVYRITRMNTVDVFYYGGSYFDLNIDIRKIEDTSSVD